MPAEAGHLRYFFDENTLGIGKIMAIARRDCVHTGHALIASLANYGDQDVDWIPGVTTQGLVVVSRDRRIRTRPAELQKFKECGARGMWFAGKKNLSNWDYLLLVARRWSDVEAFVDSHPTGPWALAINANTVEEIPLA